MDNKSSWDKMLAIMMQVFADEAEAAYEAEGPMYHYYALRAAAVFDALKSLVTAEIKLEEKLTAAAEANAKGASEIKQ